MASTDLEPGDQGDGRMLYIQAKKDQSLLGINSWEFTVTPGATYWPSSFMKTSNNP